MNRPHDADHKTFPARWKVVESPLVDLGRELGPSPVLLRNLNHADTPLSPQQEERRHGTES